MTILRLLFSNHLISHGRDIVWTSHSTDLLAADYFLWGYLKSKVYVNQPRVLEVLKTAICEGTAVISTSTLKKVFVNFVKRMENCIEKNERHLTDIIFKK